MISTPELRGSPFGDVAGEAAGVSLANRFGATDLAALRAMDAEAIVTKTAGSGWLPSAMVDGRVLPRQLVDVFDRGEQAKVPVLAGFNSGEIRSLRVLLPPAPADAATYESRIRERYGDLAGTFLERYPASRIEESMTKPFALAELSARLRALLRRGGPHESVLRVADLEMDTVRRKVRRAGTAIDLKPKEYALLEILLRHSDRPLTRALIIEHVWDIHFDSVSNVVEVHINALRNKVDKGFTPALIHTVRGVGYCLTDCPA